MRAITGLTVSEFAVFASLFPLSPACRVNLRRLILLCERQTGKRQINVLLQANDFFELCHHEEPQRGADNKTWLKLR